MRTVLLCISLILVAAIPAGASAATTAAKKKPAKLRILVTNDDGVKGRGVDALVKALRREKNVAITVITPAENQSGTGGKTTPGALEAAKTTTLGGFPAVAVKGFPADSVNYALSGPLKAKARRPQLVLSGINDGANIGPFVNLSGTVGAARAAARRGIPALATSMGIGSPTNFSAGVTQTIRWLREHRAKLKAGTVQSLNIPQCSAGRVRGRVTVPPGSDFGGRDPFGLVDCTQTTPAGADDVAAFFAGFATLSRLSRTP